MGISLARFKLIKNIIDLNNVELNSVLTYGVLYTNTNNKSFSNLIDKKIINNLTDGESLHQDELFKQLGFREVNSLDYYPHEKPTFTLDLNKPLPNKYHEKYDLVYDGGTMEHCFNVPMVFENTIKFLKKGGTIIHVNPMSGQVGHGFYQFSPTLYFDYYSTNGFDNLKLTIYVQDKNKKEYTYEGLENNLNKFYNVPRCFVGMRAFVHFSAKKIRHIDKIKYPVQAFYKNHFEKNKGIGNKDKSPSTLVLKLKHFLLKRFPTLTIYYYIKKRLKKIIL